MRLLILALDVDLSRRAGDAVHVRELAASLASMGHEVLAVVEGGGDVPSHRGPRFRVVRGKHFWSTVREVQQIAREMRADAIYERRVSPKVGCMVSRILRVPLIVEINGLPDEERSLLLGESRKQSWVRIQVRGMLLRRAKSIVAVSDSLKFAVTGRYRLPSSRVLVIPNGVNPDVFAPKDNLACKERIGLADGEPILGFVGALTPWQGVDTLIRAAAELKKVGTAVQVLVVGGGPDLVRLQSLAESVGLQDSITFAGSVPYEDVSTYIGAFDIAVALKPPGLPGSPLKVREYMACARPVIASSGTQYDFKIVADAGAGILVDPSHISEVAGRITEMLRDERRLHAMGANGRNYALTHCTWSITAQRVATACGG